MRLLVVSQYFWPENFRVNDLVAELVQRGHEVTVLTGYPNYPDGKIFTDFLADPPQFGSFKGARVVRVPLYPRGSGGTRLALNYLSFATSASVLGAWKLRGMKFDAIFVYEPSPITVGIPAIMLRALKRAPVAFWVLDLWPETLKAIGAVKSPVVLRAVGTLVSFIYNRCDLILAQSRSFISQIAKYTSDASKIRYFPSWSEDVFNRGDVAPAVEVPVKEGCFNIMFAGNIGDAQDFPAILDAAERLKADECIRWLIVGDGRMAKWVADEVMRRGLQERVVLLGRFPVERMPSFFRHADALLVSLKDEAIFSMTIPGKLQTYLAAGIPVLAMLNGEGADVVASSSAGLACRAGDAEGLARAAAQLARLSPAERVEMGRKGRRVSETEFDRTVLIGRLEEWLAGLTRKRDVRLEESL